MSSDSDSHFLTAQAWHKVGVRHHHGLCIPLFSLHTTGSFGIGEYLDLVPLIRWLPNTGLDTIQLLPINDTGTDASPYMALSAHALHPIYLSLQALPRAATVLAPWIKNLQELPPRVEYQKVLQRKLQALSVYLAEELEAIEASEGFQEFFSKNAFWLRDYALFRGSKELFQGKAWWDWPTKELPAAESRPCREWVAIQYLCFQQFQQVRMAAKSQNILLKGDVPILINKDSVDVWKHPNLFLLEKDVGAPPDMYSRDGQHWGFPLFRWPQHEKEGFSWWKQRIQVQESLYDIFRLDHFVGFYRLWAIPHGKPAKEGSFVPANPDEWKKLGEKILRSLLSSTTMLPIAEDLGDIPDLVRASMQSLGIPGIKVLRWERDWKKDLNYLSPKLFSPESLSTVSTHDSATLSEWWQSSPQESQTMAADYGMAWFPTLTPALRFSILDQAHSSGSLFHINLLSEYLGLFPELTGPSFDRINVPGTVGPHNWSCRTKPSVEEIIQHQGLHTALLTLSSHAR